MPISSTNTNPEGSMRQTSMRHRLLKNSSLSLVPLSLVPLVLFFGSTQRRPTARQTGASLTLTPTAANRNCALFWEWVAHGRSSSSSKSRAW